MDRRRLCFERRRWLDLVRFAGVLASLSPQPASGAQSQETVPTFASRVELITVDAVVLDAEGHPVPGLTRADFVVTEDGKPREIASFEAFALEPDPEPPVEWLAPASNTSPPGRNGRAFALLLDDLRIPRQESERARQAAAALIRELRNGDDVTLGTTSGRNWWSARIPEGRDDLLAVLARVEGSYVDPGLAEHMTEYEAFSINNRERGMPVPPTLSALDPSNSVTLRVLKRWMQLNLCGYEARQAVGNCDPLVKGSAARMDDARRKRDRMTLDGLGRALDSLAPARGRTSLLLFSPGFMQDSELSLREVTAAAREANTAVYFVDVRGLVTDGGIGSAAAPMQPDDPRDWNAVRFEETVLMSAGAQSLADDTGGLSVRNTNDLAAGARRIAEESRVFYLLGLHPSEGKSPQAWRSLRVDLKTPGLTVRARRGYTLRGAAKRAEKTSKDAPSPASARALESSHAISGIPLRAMVYVLEPRPGGLTHVLVGVELDAGRLAFESKGDQRVARLEVSVAALHRDSGRGFLHSDASELKLNRDESPGWRGLFREFELPSGVGQARVVIRDATGGGLGSVSQRFEVPPQDALRLSTPILSERVHPAKDSRSRPQAALAVHRTFPLEGGLYCQFEVFGAAPHPATRLPRVAAGLELRTRDGRAIRSVDPTPITPDSDGRVVRLVGLALEGLEEGPYDLVLKVQDQVSGAGLERREAFTLSHSGLAP